MLSKITFLGMFLGAILGFGTAALMGMNLIAQVSLGIAGISAVIWLFMFAFNYDDVTDGRADGRADEMVEEFDDSTADTEPVL